MTQSPSTPFRPSGAGLVERTVLVAREQVGFLRYLLEGEEGLAFLHSDGSGTVQLLAPESQVAALDRLIADLEAEGVIVHLR
ncbi:MAG: hypothetical protein JWN48_3219 [Myxococcaceae bacterium]|nr:hypothetical protein [Myxococcaceae bacterium]